MSKGARNCGAKENKETKHTHCSLWKEVERKTKFDLQCENKRAAQSAEIQKEEPSSNSGETQEVGEKDTPAVVYLK